jgi:hypothetical protein
MLRCIPVEIESFGKVKRTAEEEWRKYLTGEITLLHPAIGWQGESR